MDVAHLKFPVAVRSTYQEEDGNEKSFAGHFETVLHIEREQLNEAVAKVFASYPEAEGNEVIIQEMIEPDFSGVLFAFRKGVWKVEVVKGLGRKSGFGATNARGRITTQVSTPRYHLFSLLDGLAGTSCF